MVDGGGVGLLPALCLLRMAWVLLTLLTESCLPPSSGAMAGGGLSVTSMGYITVSMYTIQGTICIKTLTASAV